MENRNEVKIGEGTYIVERSFTPGKSVKDLLVQRLISEKKNRIPLFDVDSSTLPFLVQED